MLIQRGPRGLLGCQAEVWVGGFQVERTTEKEARRQEIRGMSEKQLAERLGCSFEEQRWKDELGSYVGSSLHFLLRAVGSH